MLEEKFDFIGIRDPILFNFWIRIRSEHPDPQPCLECLASEIRPYACAFAYIICNVNTR